MLPFLHKAELHSEFDVAQTEPARIVGRKNRGRRGDDMQVNVGQSSPVELQGRPRSVGLERRAVSRTEGIELVISEVDRLRIVRLKGRTKPVQPSKP